MQTVVQCANPFLPITAVWMYDQIRMLERYRPIVLTQERQNADHFALQDVFSAEDLPFLQRQFYRGMRKLRGTYAGYGKWIKEYDGRLIHAHFGQEGFRCLAAKKEADIPLVTTFYGMDVSQLPRQAVWQKRYARLFAEGEQFLAEGKFMAQALVDLGCLPERVAVQCLGVDLSAMPFVAPAERKYETPIVLLYAAFREKKGLIYAIQAFARVAQTFANAQLHIIGDGPLRGELESEIGKLGLTDRVTMFGFLPHEAAVGKLKQATVLLYPSVTAENGDTEGGAPVALIEAQALGTSVVSSFHADIPNVVPPEKCGLLFPERDVDGLAQGLDAVLGSEALRNEMAIAGRKHVEMHHDLVRQVKKLETVYDAVLKK